ncbi:cytidine deaminase [Mucilaginibacter gracilis]|uniref:Cytidine deaminase n=1 Tax=Mucilaginibacter gracilis TaxID=423350 RepID=A0A495J9K5_9SPHI|nr:cytidine deaminase [Mucilaginibacter gracilis]RKR85706.1 cytidine deaminase [Mucilaginibacter gracilis]
MVNKEIKIAFEDYQTIDQLNSADRDLCMEAVKALDNSHSPYSKFKVGVALRLLSGKIIYGSNQENVAYPSGLCAERVALFYWGANHPHDPIVSMAVTAHTNDFEILNPITPCGSCLQVLAEYEKKQDRPIEVMLYCQNGAIWKTCGVQCFLPFLFFEERLK